MKHTQYWLITLLIVVALGACSPPLTADVTTGNEGPARPDGETEGQVSYTSTTGLEHQNAAFAEDADIAPTPTVQTLGQEILPPLDASDSISTCAIDLVTQRHNCDEVSAIVSTQCNPSEQCLLHFNLDPQLGYNRILFDITYGREPGGWSVNIGDSPSNSGEGSDSGDQSNDAEIQIRDTTLNVYANDNVSPSDTVGDGSRLIRQVDGLVQSRSRLYLEIGNEYVSWNNMASMMEPLASPYLYALNGQADAEGQANYDIYAAFNRVIAENPSRTGSGVTSVEIMLMYVPPIPDPAPLPADTDVSTPLPLPTSTPPVELPLGTFVSDLATAIDVSEDGTVWIATDGGGVSAFDGKTWTTYTARDGLSSDNVWDVVAAPDGTLWAGTWYGVSRFNGETWTMYTTNDGLLNNNVNALAVAADGTVWAASCRGVSKFDGETWTVFGIGDGPANECIDSIAPAPDGTLWAGIHDRGVLRFDGQSWVTSLDREDMMRGVRVVSATPDGSVWAVTDGSSVYRFKGGAWTTVRSSDEGYRVYSLAVSDAETVWIGAGGYVDEVSGAGFRREATFEGDFFSPVFVAAASGNSLWVAANGYAGVRHVAGNSWASYAPENTSASDIRNQAVYALKAKTATLANVEKIEVIHGTSNGALSGHFGAEYVRSTQSITDPGEIQRIVAGFTEAGNYVSFWTRCGFYVKVNFYLQDGQVQTFLVGIDDCLSFTAESIHAVGTMSNDYLYNEYVKPVYGR